LFVFCNNFFSLAQDERKCIDSTSRLLFCKGKEKSGECYFTKSTKSGIDKTASNIIIKQKIHQH
jgi:hypothetical protein